VVHNLFNYASGDPVNRIDPSGREDFEDVAAQEASTLTTFAKWYRATKQYILGMCKMLVDLQLAAGLLPPAPEWMTANWELEMWEQDMLEMFEALCEKSVMGLN
jgi:hypothetical protein